MNPWRTPLKVCGLLIVAAYVIELYVHGHDFSRLPDIRNDCCKFAIIVAVLTFYSAWRFAEAKDKGCV